MYIPYHLCFACFALCSFLIKKEKTDYYYTRVAAGKKLGGHVTRSSFHAFEEGAIVIESRVLHATMGLPKEGKMRKCDLEVDHIFFCIVA